MNVTYNPQGTTDYCDLDCWSQHSLVPVKLRGLQLLQRFCKIEKLIKLIYRSWTWSYGHRRLGSLEDSRSPIWPILSPNVRVQTTADNKLRVTADCRLRATPLYRSDVTIRPPKGMNTIFFISSAYSSGPWSVTRSKWTLPFAACETHQISPIFVVVNPKTNHIYLPIKFNESADCDDWQWQAIRKVDR